MGLLNKIKGILFEEVEEDEVVSTPKSEEKKPIAEKIEPQRKVEEPVEKSVPKVTAPVKETKTENLNERDLFKSDNISPFFDFDEEEFSNMSRVQKPKTTNVMEYERKKRVEKRYDMGNFSKIERTEVVEKKKFKPSPIISPVYGILNEDYKPEDIIGESEAIKEVKRLIEKAGGTPELVYMKASKGTLQKRLYKRNQSLNANSPFIITNEILEHHYNDFQEPCGEGEKVILQE